MIKNVKEIGGLLFCFTILQNKYQNESGIFGFFAF
jgi:hypothetical protein